ncbi:MAG TPA: hypothetical protein PLS49_08975 [Candidatus Woesebacteria bacterium]|nr:hypothetical protein [Candidatus Woesebacteria bacterium]
MNPESLTDTYLLKNYFGGIGRLSDTNFSNFFVHANSHYGSQRTIEYAGKVATVHIEPFYAIINRKGEVFREDEILNLAGYQKAKRIRVTTTIRNSDPLSIQVPEAIYNSAIFEWHSQESRLHYLNSLVRTYGIPHTLGVLAMNGFGIDEACITIKNGLEFPWLDGRRLNQANSDDLGRVIEKFIDTQLGSGGQADNNNLVGSWNKLVKISGYENRLPTDKEAIRDFLRLQYFISSLMANSSGYSCPYEVNSARLFPIDITDGVINIVLISQQEEKDIQYAIKFNGDTYFLLTAYVRAYNVEPTDTEVPYLSSLKYYDSQMIFDD